MKTYLAQNQFISNSAGLTPVTAESAAASSLVRADAGAAAAPFDSSCGGLNAHQSRERCADNGPAFSEAVEVASDPHETDHIHEIFFYARKLIKQAPRYLLDEGAFMAEIEEVPLFIREDGYLKRQA